MTASWRFSALGSRHKAMGSDLEDWSGIKTKKKSTWLFEQKLDLWMYLA